MKIIKYKINYKNNNYQITVKIPSEDLTIYQANLLFYYSLNEKEQPEYKHILWSHGGNIQERDKQFAKQCQIIKIEKVEEKKTSIFNNF